MRIHLIKSDRLHKKHLALGLIKKSKWNIKTRMKQSMKRMIHQNQLGLEIQCKDGFRMIHDISRYKKKNSVSISIDIEEVFHNIQQLV